MVRILGILGLRSFIDRSLSHCAVQTSSASVRDFSRTRFTAILIQVLPFRVFSSRTREQYGLEYGYSSKFPSKDPQWFILVSVFLFRTPEDEPQRRLLLELSKSRSLCVQHSGVWWVCVRAVPHTQSLSSPSSSSIKSFETRLVWC